MSESVDPGNVFRLPGAKGSGQSLDGGGDPPHSPGMEARLAKLETSLDWIKAFLAVIVAVTLGGFGFMGIQINRLDGRVDRLEGKVDALGSRLTEEFKALRADMTAEARANRAEMSAQTAAIAGSITATRQVQPQIVVLPMPVPPAPEPKPAP